MLTCVTAAVSCRSFSPAPHDLARELLSTGPPSPTFQRVTTDIHVDQAVLDAMRSRAASDGVTLLAVARVPRGIHPYEVLVWLQKNDTVAIVNTAVYWGRVDGKWRTSATRDEIAELATAAEAEFACVQGPLREAIYGTGYAIWRGDQQTTCERGLFAGDEHSTFSTLLEEIYDREVQSYDAFADTSRD